MSTQETAAAAIYFAVAMKAESAYYQDQEREQSEKLYKEIIGTLQ